MEGISRPAPGPGFPGPPRSWTRRSPVADRDLLAQTGQGLVLQHDELLVRRRLAEHREPVPAQDLLEPLGGLDPVPSDLPIEAVGEQGVELHAEDAALCQHGKALLRVVGEMRRSSVREDQRLAAERAALGSADVEGVAEGGDRFQIQVGCPARKTVGQPRAVQIQAQTVLPANGGDVLQLPPGIETAPLRRVRHVDHARPDDVLAVLIRQHGLGQLAYRGGGQLAVPFGQEQELAADGLQTAGLVDVDMSGLRRHHALPGPKQGGDRHHVDLGPAAEEKDGAVGAAAGVQDLPLRRPRPPVVSVARAGLQIGFQQALHQLRMRPGNVITLKIDHTISYPVIRRRICVPCAFSQASCVR